jgi:hypothetical protein
MLNEIASVSDGQGVKKSGTVSKLDAGYHSKPTRSDDVDKYEGRIFTPSVRARRHRTESDPDLSWLVECSASAMGAKGTLAGVIAQCERGSVGGTSGLDDSGSFAHKFTDEQLGLGSHVFGSVEKCRWLWSAWCKCSVRTRNVLLAYYEPIRSELRSDSGFGAKDRWVEGSDQPHGQHGQVRTGVEAKLGEHANLAFALARDPARLLLACREPEPMRKGKVNVEEAKRRRVVVADAIKTARVESEMAHKEWFSHKNQTAPMRNTAQRRKVFPAHNSGADAE